MIWQGGGGWGDPLEREAAAVANDVVAGAVSLETAREIYGVVVENGSVDEAATERQRETIRKTILPTLYYLVFAGAIGMIAFYVLGVSDPLIQVGS